MSWNFADKLFAYEAGELDQEETLQLFQYLVDSGIILELQGAHQRTAQTYIDAGLITPPAYAQEIGDE